MLPANLSRLILAAAVVGPGPWPAAAATERPAGRVTDLAERLTTGLGVRAPDDVAFCERVARLVQEGRLPADLVDSTYTWAIGRGREHPFPAFRHALRIQAAKLGAAL